MGTPTKRKLGVHTYFIEDDDEVMLIASPPPNKRKSGSCMQSEDILNVSDSDAAGVIVEDQIDLLEQAVVQAEQLEISMMTNDTCIEPLAESPAGAPAPVPTPLLSPAVTPVNPIETTNTSNTLVENPIKNPEAVMKNLVIAPLELKSPIDNLIATPIENSMKTQIETPMKTLFENPTKTPIENPMKTLFENPVNTLVENPAKTLVENPAKTLAENAVKTLVENPGKTLVENPVQSLVEKPMKTLVEKPMKIPVETPVVTLVETPTETSAKTLTDDKTAVDPRTILGKQAKEISNSSVVASTTQCDDLEEGELTDQQTQLGAIIVSRTVESVDDRCPPWQQSTSSVGDRLRFVFQNNEFSDCSVTAGVVGKQKTFACHKVILSMTSSKLKSILMDSNHVNLNMKQEVFEVLLQYMYLDSFKLSSVEAACEVYKAALQYDVPHLLKLTRDFMLKNLSPDNIWNAFDLAVECDDRQLKAGCSSSLAENPSSWNYLSNVKRTLLLFILDLKTINIQEITVLKAVDEWAMQQCIHLDINPNLFNKRQIVGPEIMSKIRFLAISPQDFVSYCECGKSFLTTEEMFAILCWLTIPKSQILPDWVCPLSISRGTSQAFRLKRRKNFSFAVQQNNYFTEAYALTGPAMNFHVGAKQFTTCLKVSKPIVLQGIQVPALWYPPFHQEQNRTYEEIYEIEIIDSENNLLTTATVVLDVQFASVVDIVFKEAVTLDSSVDYKINISTSKMYFLTKEFRTSEMAEKVKFTFQDKVIPDKSYRNEALQNAIHCGFILQIVFSVFL